MKDFVYNLCLIEEKGCHWDSQYSFCVEFFQQFLLCNLAQFCGEVFAKLLQNEFFVNGYTLLIRIRSIILLRFTVILLLLIHLKKTTTIGLKG